MRANRYSQIHKKINAMGCDGLENPVWKAESCAALSTVQRLATAIETRTPYERLLAVSSAFHK